MAPSGQHFRGAPAAAWWRKAAKRPAVLWTVLALDLFLLLEGVGAVAYLGISRVDPVNVGRLAVTTAEVRAERAAISQPAPVAVIVPRLGIRSDLVRLAVDATGELEVPEDFEVAGWWEAGPKPGALGAAVIVGHVDSHRGGAIFERLRVLEPKDHVEVLREDGSSVVFEIDALRQYPKDSLPTNQIYGPTPGAELRLITCGGRFDRRTKSYEDNVVVFAREIDRKERQVAA